MTKLSLTLLVIFLVLSACSSIPKAPVIEQLGYSVKFKKFRGCNTETGACRNIPRDDPSMEGVQGLSAADFKAYNAWIDQLIDLLQQKKLQLMQEVQVTE